jgi:hypothetical protein
VRRIVVRTKRNGKWLSHSSWADIPVIVLGVVESFLNRETCKLGKVESITRLVLDRRMYGVWRELYKRNSGGGFFYPAKPAAYNDWIECFKAVPDKRLSRQDLAVGMLVYWSCVFTDDVIFRRMTLTQEENSAFIRDIQEQAARLRDEAKQFRARFLITDVYPEGRWIPGAERHAIDVARAADFVEEYACKHSANRRLLVPDRDRGERKSRAFVMRLSEYSQRYFGQKLVGTLATTASVLIGERISRQRALDWCRSAGIGR